jgi:integrase
MIAAKAPGLSDGWVFPTSVGTLMMHSTLQKPLKAALAEAGIKKRFTIHGFRRTFNNLLRQATSGEVVRSMTGHVTERMTEHYSHVDADEKRAAVRLALAPLSGAGARKHAEGPSTLKVGTQVGTAASSRSERRASRPLTTRELN